MYLLYRDWCRETNQTSWCEEFTEARLHLRGNATETAYVYLNGKAADMRWLVEFLYLQVVKHEALVTATEEGRLVYAVVWGLASYYKVILSADKYLTAEESELIETSLSTSLICYNCLTVMFAGGPRWRPKPKDHQVDHMLEICKSWKLNPRDYWGYKNEDMIGVVKRMCHLLHRVTIMDRFMQHYCLDISIKLAEVRDAMR
jgi:hypothetical protein